MPKLPAIENAAPADGYEDESDAMLGKGLALAMGEGLETMLQAEIEETGEVSMAACE